MAGELVKPVVEACRLKAGREVREGVARTCSAKKRAKQNELERLECKRRLQMDVGPPYLRAERAQASEPETVAPSCAQYGRPRALHAFLRI